jgi:anti-anti-sigma regulatory factor
LRDVTEKLEEAGSGVILDFSAVHRIDSATLRAMETLAIAAREKSIKPALRGVNVEVYKVLKLARLTSQFSFVN